MGFFFVDESIQQKAGFILAAVVYCERDPGPDVDQLLIAAGFTPRQDEFKSSFPMNAEPERQALRDSLLEYLFKVRLGLVVTPVSARSSLGDEIMLGIEKFCRANLLESSPHAVYLDQGIAFWNRKKALADFESRVDGSVWIEQDSRVVGGIQLADLASHTLGMLLLTQLGWTDKRVPAPKHCDFDSDGKLALSDELRARVRHLFFTLDGVDLSGDPSEGFTLETADYALHIASGCDHGLRTACNECFGSTYVGCML